jgi:carboxypeptidase C (cathepsin A)
MLEFYKDFPEYLQRPLYIQGISFGGVYAPILGMKIHQHNLEMNLTG